MSARTSAGIETCPFDETFMTSAVGVEYLLVARMSNHSA